MNNSATYTKSRLIKELAFTAGISQVKSRLVLDALHTIISREAALGPFILPGICKFDTAMRKARKMRNPRTGEALLLPAHKVIRLTPAKSLRQAVAPRVAAVKAPAEESAAVASAPIAPAAVPEVMEAAPAPASVPAPAPASVPAPASAAEPSAPPPPPPAEKGVASAADDFILPDLVPGEPVAPAVPKAESAEPEQPTFTVAPNGDITFHCQRCGQEIEAPGDMAGTDAECPMCGSPIHVPTPTGASPTGNAAQNVVSASEAEAIDPEALKNKTIRIDATELGFDTSAPAPQQSASGDASGMISFFCPGCHQEIEATADMAGTTSECPNCGTEFEVPFFSEKGTIHAEKEELFDPRKANEQKHKTMRIDLDDF